MKNIEKIKARYIKLFAKKYYNMNTVSKVKEADLLVCSYLAEFWAYVHSVIPEDYGRFTIFDFVGCIVDSKTNIQSTVIPAETTLCAKNKICKYCWNLDWNTIKEKKEQMSQVEVMKFLRKNNITDRRLEDGDNVVIHGASNKPIGRTMVASIIMKEVIKLRITHHIIRHTYDWIDFSTLMDAVSKDSFDLADYKSCDCLVIDNIINKYRSVKQTNFLIDLLDPFFINRFNNNLTTILVFKFDINNESVNIETTFGVGVNKIIESNRTCKIFLTGKDISVNNG